MKITKTTLLIIAILISCMCLCACSKNETSVDSKTPPPGASDDVTAKVQPNITMQTHDAHYNRLYRSKPNYIYSCEPGVKVTKIPIGKEVAVDGETYMFETYYDVTYENGLIKSWEYVLDFFKCNESGDNISLYRQKITFPDLDQPIPNPPYVLFDNVDNFYVYDAFVTHIISDGTCTAIVEGEPYKIGADTICTRYSTPVVGDKYVLSEYNCNSGKLVDKVRKVSHLIDKPFSFDISSDDYDWQTPYHIVLNDLPAFDNNDKEITLKKDTKLKITATDLQSKVFFITEDNKEGYFTYSFEDFKINGKDETHYLSNIAYAS